MVSSSSSFFLNTLGNFVLSEYAGGDWGVFSHAASGMARLRSGSQVALFLDGSTCTSAFQNTMIFKSHWGGEGSVGAPIHTD